MAGALADTVVAVHLLAIAFMLTGGLLVRRWGRVLVPHLVTAGTILVVNRLGAPCPLTELELQLRERAGEPGYAGGFIEHYLIEPVHPAGITSSVEVLIYLVAVTPNVLAYAAVLTTTLARHRQQG